MTPDGWVAGGRAIALVALIVVASIVTPVSAAVADPGGDRTGQADLGDRGGPPAAVAGGLSAIDETQPAVALKQRALADIRGLDDSTRPREVRRELALSAIERGPRGIAGPTASRARGSSSTT